LRRSKPLDASLYKWEIWAPSCVGTIVSFQQYGPVRRLPIIEGSLHGHVTLPQNPTTIAWSLSPHGFVVGAMPRTPILSYSLTVA
jgi:hypothetical protein